MKIYTKTGDKGDTGLVGGGRIRKDSLRIEAYGTVDELNCIIGVCRSMNTIQSVDVILEEMQRNLFTLGADLAAPLDGMHTAIKRIDSSHVVRIEAHIDAIEPTLEPLKHFILPGGSSAAAMLHVARAVCRRAERLVVRLAREEQIGEFSVTYLNRLSDFLFVLARKVNALDNKLEVQWIP